MTTKRFARHVLSKARVPIALASLSLALAVPAGAQWKVIDLQPAGAGESKAMGVRHGQQVGYATVNGAFHACTWTGTAGSWVDLNPTSNYQGNAYDSSIAMGVDRGRQVGYAFVHNTNVHAGSWFGTAASWGEINQADSTFSIAYGICEDEVVGWNYNGTYYATLWSGNAEVSLGSAFIYSVAYGVSRGHQVGQARLPGPVFHASLWSGTAESWVDLNPTDSEQSTALGVDGGEQVGSSNFASVTHAGLWTGTALSWVDLAPPGATASECLGVDAGQQVGYATIGGVNHASVWSDTVASWVDLQTFLPAEFTQSSAQGIWHDLHWTYVVGYGFNSLTNRNEALMWVRRRELSRGGSIHL